MCAMFIIFPIRLLSILLSGASNKESKIRNLCIKIYVQGHPKSIPVKVYSRRFSSWLANFRDRIDFYFRILPAGTYLLFTLFIITTSHIFPLLDYYSRGLKLSQLASILSVIKQSFLVWLRV